MASQTEHEQARIRVASIRSLVSVLNAIKPSGTKQQVRPEPCFPRKTHRA